MRILHVIGTLSPDSGGPAEALRMIVAFAPEGTTSEIVTMDDPGAGFLASFPYTVHALGHAGAGFGYSAALLPWLTANRDRFDGVVVHGLWTYVGEATRKAFAGRRPYIVFVHGMLDPYFKRAFPLKHAKKWVFWLASQYWTLRRARYALFTTREEAELAKQSFFLHRWNTAILPLGTEALLPATGEDHEAFYALAPGALAPGALAPGALAPGAGGRRFLLFMGRIHPKKGPDLLLDAFLAIAAEQPDLDLVIAGPDSPDHAEWVAGLRTRAERSGFGHRVHWPGMIKGSAKRGALDLCEAFVLPSHQENFGVAVAEALSAGKPVLLSDKINIAHEIAGSGAGFVEQDTPEGTARLLQRWLGLDAFARESMGAAALRAFAEHYDMRRNAAILPRLFAGAEVPVAD